MPHLGIRNIETVVPSLQHLQLVVQLAYNGVVKVNGHHGSRLICIF
jgi:hypothetical protein